MYFPISIICLVAVVFEIKIIKKYKSIKERNNNKGENYSKIIS